MKQIILMIMFGAYVRPIFTMDVLFKAVDMACDTKKTLNTHGLVEMLGRRNTMEDATDAYVQHDYAFFAVYDGHNGKAVAEIAKNNLRKNCNLENAHTDEEIVAALKKGFIDTHASIQDKRYHQTGSTATVAVIKNKKIFVANAGDSRTVLACGDTAVPLSVDHKPNLPGEAKRILDGGGSISYDRWSRVWRVCEMLSVSRALGDKYLSPYLIPDPEITVTPLAEDHKFLILACDGIWDVMKNEEAVNHVKKTLCEHHNDCTRAARYLAHDALNFKGSTDNISAIVVNLKSFMQE